MKWIVQPIVYYLFFLAFLLGMFTEVLIISTIVFIHEMGHYLAARFLEWEIDSVKFWFFGATMVTQEFNHRHLYEEIFVTISGPLQHIWIFFFVTVFGEYIFPSHTVELILKFNLVILLFNLLPIYPLDGGRFVFLCSQLLLPFQRAHVFVLYHSLVWILMVMIGFFYYQGFNLSLFCLLIFLVSEIYIEWRQRKFYFIRFLLRRATKRVNYRKKVELTFDHWQQLSQLFRTMYRFRLHVFRRKNTNEIYQEHHLLQKYFYGE